MTEKIDWEKPRPKIAPVSFGREPSLKEIALAYYSARITATSDAESAALEYMEAMNQDTE